MASLHVTPLKTPQAGTPGLSLRVPAPALQHRIAPITSWLAQSADRVFTLLSPNDLVRPEVAFGKFSCMAVKLVTMVIQV
jgi:hypothetical protein